MVLKFYAGPLELKDGARQFAANRNEVNFTTDFTDGKDENDRVIPFLTIKR